MIKTVFVFLIKKKYSVKFIFLAIKKMFHKTDGEDLEKKKNFLFEEIWLNKETWTLNWYINYDTS